MCSHRVSSLVLCSSFRPYYISVPAPAAVAECVFAYPNGLPLRLLQVVPSAQVQQQLFCALHIALEQRPRGCNDRVADVLGRTDEDLPREVNRSLPLAGSSNYF
jgi:hypothetical protein